MLKKSSSCSVDFSLSILSDEIFENVENDFGFYGSVTPAHHPHPQEGPHFMAPQQFVTAKKNVSTLLHFLNKYRGNIHSCRESICTP